MKDSDYLNISIGVYVDMTYGLSSFLREGVNAEEVFSGNEAGSSVVDDLWKILDKR